MTTASAVTAPAPLPSSPAATLPYADLPARWGICVEKLADGVRVVVPPVPGWRHLGAGYYLGAAVLGLILIGFVLGGLITGEWQPPTILNGMAYGSGLLWVILAARHRLRRRIVAEVTGRAVSVTQLSGRGTARRREWPRSLVAQIKLNASNGKLVVRVTGVTFVEFYLSPNEELNQYVADLLASALKEPVRVTPAEPAPSASPVDRARHDGVASPRLRRVLLGVAAVMALAGVVVMLLPFEASALGVYLLIFAAAPVGIALGTQDKEFYA